MKKGLFVTFEGGEGAGKSTLARRLGDTLKAQEREVVFTREPGGTSLGEELRALLLHSDTAIDPRTELFLFLAARVQHIEEVIRPALLRGAVVLCDRFSDSTIAYQGEGKGLGFEYVQTLCSLAQKELEPDLTFFINLDPAVGLLRTDRRRDDANDASGRDRMEQEKLEFHVCVQRGFKRLAALYPKRIHTLDGTRTPDELYTQAVSILQGFV